MSCSESAAEHGGVQRVALWRRCLLGKALDTTWFSNPRQEIPWSIDTTAIPNSPMHKKYVKVQLEYLDVLHLSRRALLVRSTSPPHLIISRLAQRAERPPENHTPRPLRGLEPRNVHAPVSKRLSKAYDSIAAVAHLRALLEFICLHAFQVLDGGHRREQVTSVMRRARGRQGRPKASGWTRTGPGNFP